MLRVASVLAGVGSLGQESATMCWMQLVTERARQFTGLVSVFKLPGVGGRSSAGANNLWAASASGICLLGLKFQV